MSDAPEIFDTSDGLEFDPNHKSGYIAILGRPNAGKSTLMNSFIGQKLSVVTFKAQTTRHQITGIFSDEDCQMVFLDTPGMLDPQYKLHEAMMAAVDKARRDADVIIHLVDCRKIDYALENIDIIAKSGGNIILGLNKIDIASEENIEKLEAKLTSEITYKSVHRLSASTGEGVPELLAAIKELMPLGPPFYDKEQLSDQPQRFFASELIREQLFLQYDKEIPYSCAVNIVEYDEQDEIDHVHAEIVIERDSQKGIIIGKGGKAIKKLGTESRKSIEALVGKKVNLQLFVKVRNKWRENDTFLRSYGYR